MPNEFPFWTQPALARRVHRALRLTKARSGPGMNADCQDFSFKYKELIE